MVGTFYARANPVRFSDPSGELSLVETMVAIGVLGIMIGQINLLLDKTWWKKDLEWNGTLVATSLSLTFAVDAAEEGLKKTLQAGLKSFSSLLQFLALPSPEAGLLFYRGTSDCTLHHGVKQRLRDGIWGMVVTGAGVGIPIGATWGKFKMASPEWYGPSNWTFAGGVTFAAATGAYGTGVGGTYLLAGWGEGSASVDDEAQHPDDFLRGVDASVDFMGGFSIPLIMGFHEEGCRE